jgi:hypothetical protein
MMPAVWTAVVGVVVLLLLVPVVRRPVRRFGAARQALHGALAPRLAVLRTVARARPRS